LDTGEIRETSGLLNERRLWRESKRGFEERLKEELPDLERATLERRLRVVTELMPAPGRVIPATFENADAYARDEPTIYSVAKDPSFPAATSSPATLSVGRVLSKVIAKTDLGTDEIREYVSRFEEPLDGLLRLEEFAAHSAGAELRERIAAERLVEMLRGPRPPNSAEDERFKEIQEKASAVLAALLDEESPPCLVPS
jgi:hypothetical protein